MPNGQQQHHHHHHHHHHKKKLKTLLVNTRPRIFENEQEITKIMERMGR
jgi:hypothetical protein